MRDLSRLANAPMNTAIEQSANAPSPHSLVFNYGPLLTGPELWNNLAYRSGAALRQAARRGTTPVKVFSIPGRKGLFARTADVDVWLASLPKTEPDCVVATKKIT
jgi:hypothetical protein